MNMQQEPNYENDENVLQKFGRNINEEVKKGKVDPVIGRSLRHSFRHTILTRSGTQEAEGAPLLRE